VREAVGQTQHGLPMRVALKHPDEKKIVMRRRKMKSIGYHCRKNNFDHRDRLAPENVGFAQ